MRYIAAKPVNTPVMTPDAAKIGAYAKIPGVFTMSAQAPSCPALCAMAARALTIQSWLSLNSPIVTHITIYASIPPAALYMNVEGLPANIAPIIILAASIAPASFLPSIAIAVRVMMFARPSFIPGIGTGDGSWFSIMNIVSAIAVSTAMKQSFFVLAVELPSLYLYHQPVRHTGYRHPALAYPSLTYADTVRAVRRRD